MFSKIISLKGLRFERDCTFYLFFYLYSHPCFHFLRKWHLKIFLKRADQAIFLNSLEQKYQELTYFYYIVPFPVAFSFSTLIITCQNCKQPLWLRLVIILNCGHIPPTPSPSPAAVRSKALGNGSSYVCVKFEKKLKLLLFSLLLLLICNLL